MNDYKLVPMEPTPEMVEAAEDAYMPFGDMDLALRVAILAAPDVQGEPVAWHASDDFPDSLPNTWSREVVAVTNFGRVCRLSCMGTYWQRPGDFSEGEEVVAWADFPGLERATDAFAVQQPAPDVTALVEALEWIRGAINCTPENDKHQSGTWISTSHPRIRQIDELLAAHRKGGCK